MPYINKDGKVAKMEYLDKKGDNTLTSTSWYQSQAFKDRVAKSTKYAFYSGAGALVDIIV